MFSDIVAHFVRKGEDEHEQTMDLDPNKQQFDQGIHYLPMTLVPGSPSADSRRAVVSFWQKILINCLED